MDANTSGMMKAGDSDAAALGEAATTAIVGLHDDTAPQEGQQGQAPEQAVELHQHGEQVVGLQKSYHQFKLFSLSTYSTVWDRSQLHQIKYGQ